MPPAVLDAVRRLGAVLRGSEPYLEVLTSGSTGTPKLVRLTGVALSWSARATHDWLGGPGRWVLALSPERIAGLQVLTRSILAADAGVARSLIVAESGFSGLAAALAAAHFDDAPVYVSLVPTQLVQMLRAGHGASLAACSGVLVGGAAIAPDLVAAAQDAGIRLVRTYGMTETAGGCVYNGEPLRGVRVRINPYATAQQITSSAAIERPAPVVSAVGRIELSGPMLATGVGYADSSDDGAVWFATNDIGRFDAAGRLEVLGRLDDVIISGGVNIHPAAVEAAVRPVLSAIFDTEMLACAIGVPDVYWGQAVAVVAAPLASGTAHITSDQNMASSNPTPANRPSGRLQLATARQLAQVRAAIVDRTLAPRHFIILDELPTLSSGKVDRQRLARLAFDLVGARWPDAISPHSAVIADAASVPGNTAAPAAPRGKAA